MTIEELIQIKTDLESKVVSVSTLEEEIKTLENNIEEFELQLDAIALKISDSRIKF